MEEYQGIISCRLNHVGTHSEGRYAFLVPDEGEELPLCREGVAPFNDTFFEPFDGQRVSVAATMSHGWLIVESVAPAAFGAEENVPAADTDETSEPAAAEGDPEVETSNVNDNTEQL